MGWAKYREDDLSIFCGRMYMLENRTMVQPLPCSPAKEKVVARAPIKAAVNKPRHGLELRLQVNDSSEIARKLQLHGWWWSRLYACWCNDDLQVNRNFAKAIISSTPATLRVNT